MHHKINVSGGQLSSADSTTQAKEAAEILAVTRQKARELLESAIAFSVVTVAEDGQATRLTWDSAVAGAGPYIPLLLELGVLAVDRFYAAVQEANAASSIPKEGKH